MDSCFRRNGEVKGAILWEVVTNTVAHRTRVIAHQSRVPRRN